jgi:hypothetical protein
MQSVALQLDTAIPYYAGEWLLQLRNLTVILNLQILCSSNTESVIEVSMIFTISKPAIQ